MKEISATQFFLHIFFDIFQIILKILKKLLLYGIMNKKQFDKLELVE